MVRRKVIVGNVYGIHIRPAINIAMACMGMDSKVTIRNGLKNANCFSILELLQLEANFGSEVEIVVEGTDEERGIERIAGLFV
jgi:phosphocarrier protein